MDQKRYVISEICLAEEAMSRTAVLIKDRLWFSGRFYGKTLEYITE